MCFAVFSVYCQRREVVSESPWPCRNKRLARADRGIHTAICWRIRKPWKSWLHCWGHGLSLNTTKANNNIAMLGNIFHSISLFSLFTGTASRVKGLGKRMIKNREDYSRVCRSARGKDRQLQECLGIRARPDCAIKKKKSGFLSLKCSQFHKTMETQHWQRTIRWGENNCSGHW